jgi:hypothetical protein
MGMEAGEKNYAAYMRTYNFLQLVNQVMTSVKLGL